MKKFSQIKVRKIDIEKIQKDVLALLSQFKTAETFEAIL